MAPRNRRERRGKKKNSDAPKKNEEQDLIQGTKKVVQKEDTTPDSERTDKDKTEAWKSEQTHGGDQDRDRNKSRKRKKSKTKSSDREQYKKRKDKAFDNTDHSDGEEAIGYREHRHQQDNIWDNEGHSSDRDKSLGDRPLIFKTDEEVLMILKHPSEICLKGKCQLISLCGTVTILGYHVTPSVKSCDFYSPESNSLLTIKTFETEASNKLYNEICAKYLDKKARKKFPKNGVILCLKKLDSVMCDYISKLSPFQQLFSVSEYANENTNTDLVNSSVDVAFVSKEINLPRLKIPEDYCYLAETFTGALDTGSNPVTVVCGGKNSGKSTLNRFLLNTALNKIDRVYYLECDVGQTEFTPPGCVSFHTVESPVIGPPFCHQRQPTYSCYFGGNSPADDPDYYIKCLRQCYNYYRQLNTKLPLVVNTMGWNKGLGLDLMVDTLQLVKPDFVIQLDCYNQSLNFPALTPDFVSGQGWLAKSQMVSGEATENYDRQDHKLIIIESAVAQQEQQSSMKLKALDHRNLSILGYLSQCIEPGMTLTSVPPYVVAWNTVGIHVIHEVVQRSQIMYALNGTIVALCNADLSQAYRDDDDSPWWYKQVPDARCIGFGMVRGIDPEDRKIYIVTPLSTVQLKQVNTLIRGSTNIPEQVLLKQKCGGTLPYVDITTSSTGASALRQRKHMPRKYNTDYKF